MKFFTENHVFGSPAGSDLQAIRLFHDINLKNNGVIAFPRFSTVCGSVRTCFGDIGEKFTYVPVIVHVGFENPGTCTLNRDFTP